MRVKSDEEFHRTRIILKGDKKIKIKKYEKVNQNACKKRHKRVKYTELKNVKKLTLTKRLGCRQAVRLRTLTPSSGSSNLSTPARQKEQASACFFSCEAVKMTAFVCLDFPKFIAVKMRSTLKPYFLADCCKGERRCISIHRARICKNMQKRRL